VAVIIVGGEKIFGLPLVRGGGGGGNSASLELYAGAKRGGAVSSFE